MNDDERTENAALWTRVFNATLTGTASFDPDDDGPKVNDIVETAIMIADEACRRVSIWVPDGTNEAARIEVVD